MAKMMEGTNQPRQRPLQSLIHSLSYRIEFMLVPYTKLMNTVDPEDVSSDPKYDFSKSWAALKVIENIERIPKELKHLGSQNV